MPHSRERFALSLLSQRLRQSPVVLIQGARQVGKSFLVQNLLKEALPLKSRATFKYLTLDSPSLRREANQNPETFILERDDAYPLAIDEAQKAPDLFDVVKMRVDQKRVPGKFILLGSTEFSHRSRVRESLTGRASILRCFPMTLGETLGLKAEPSRILLDKVSDERVSREDLIRYLMRGGFPGIFSLRSDTQRQEALSGWIELTTRRDLLELPKRTLNSELAYQIINYLAVGAQTDLASIAKSLRLRTTVVKSHLEALETLFVVNPIYPSKLGAGKVRYLLCDVSIVNFFDGGLEQKLRTFILQELLVAASLINDPLAKINYYTTSRGSVIDFLYEIKGKRFAIKIIPSEQIDERELYVCEGLQKKDPNLEIFILGPLKTKIRGFQMLPWEAIA